MVAFSVASSSSYCSSSISPLGSSRSGVAGILMHHSMSALLHLGKSTNFQGHGIECIQPFYDISGPPPALVPPVMPMFIARHVTGQFRLLILMAPCWMEVPWLPKALNMLEDIPWHCPFVKDLVMNVSVGQMLKHLHLPSLHLTLWLFRDMWCADKSSSVCQALVEQLECLQ